MTTTREEHNRVSVGLYHHDFTSRRARLGLPPGRLVRMARAAAMEHDALPASGSDSDSESDSESDLIKHHYTCLLLHERHDDVAIIRREEQRPGPAVPRRARGDAAGRFVGVRRTTMN